MLAIVRREIKNYLKRPLFWIGIVIVILGVFQQVSPYLSTHYLAPGEEIINEYPDSIHEGDVYEGYVPSTEEQRRESWEKQILENFVMEFQMDQAEAEAVIARIKGMDVKQASQYLEEQCHYGFAIGDYQFTAYHKGTREEINSYLSQKLEKKPFSFYFSKKFADFTGLFMGFFAAIMLSLLFLQDTRKNTYELLHTKPVSAGKYITGKVAGGFTVCLIVLAILNVTFWILCSVITRGNGFEVRLSDFITATCLYILPNMLMIVSVYTLISLIFKNPLPGVPLLILYIVYSNMGTRNAEGLYGFYGRPLAIMVRFPGTLFDVAPPPMALLNQSFLLLASAVLVLVSMLIWKRRRM